MNPLDVIPMTAAEVTDLVDRVRASQQLHAPTGLGERAARLARERGVHIRIAARELGATYEATRLAWHRLYGDVSWAKHNVGRGQTPWRRVLP